MYLKDAIAAAGADLRDRDLFLGEVEGGTAADFVRAHAVSGDGSALRTPPPALLSPARREMDGFLYGSLASCSGTAYRPGLWLPDERSVLVGGLMLEAACGAAACPCAVVASVAADGSLAEATLWAFDAPLALCEAELFDRPRTEFERRWTGAAGMRDLVAEQLREEGHAAQEFVLAERSHVFLGGCLAWLRARAPRAEEAAPLRAALVAAAALLGPPPPGALLPSRAPLVFSAALCGGAPPPAATPEAAEAIVDALGCPLFWAAEALLLRGRERDHWGAAAEAAAEAAEDAALGWAAAPPDPPPSLKAAMCAAAALPAESWAPPPPALEALAESSLEAGLAELFDERQRALALACISLPALARRTREGAFAVLDSEGALLFRPESPEGVRVPPRAVSRLLSLPRVAVVDPRDGVKLLRGARPQLRLEPAAEPPDDRAALAAADGARALKRVREWLAG